MGVHVRVNGYDWCVGVLLVQLYNMPLKPLINTDHRFVHAVPLGRTSEKEVPWVVLTWNCLGYFFVTWKDSRIFYTIDSSWGKFPILLLSECIRIYFIFFTKEIHDMDCVIYFLLWWSDIWIRIYLWNNGIWFLLKDTLVTERAMILHFIHSKVQVAYAWYMNGWYDIKIYIMISFM